ncbi:MAG: penicillin-binding protein 2 [bacterium]
MSSKKLSFVSIIIITLFSCLGFRMYYLQVWKSDYFKKYAKRQYIRTRNVSSLRGRILDRKGRVLAFSTFADSCYADPSLITDSREAAKKLDPFLNISEEGIISKIASVKNRFVWLERKMPAEDVIRIKSLDIKGIGFIREEKRLYPYGNIAGHLIGMLGSENQPLSGIEYSAEHILSGTVRTTKTSRDALGNEISLGSRTLDSVQMDVTLTIDRTIQYIAEAELQRSMEESDAEQGVVIIQEPVTGEILALAIYPQLDISADCTSVKDLKNIAISGIWEPGSTFKLIPVAAALEEGIVGVDDTFDCENGEYRVGDRVIHDHNKHGVLSVQEIVAQSSNIGMAKIGSMLGKEKMYYYTRAFGFGAYSGISLVGETKGIFRSSKYWSSVSVSMLSFGHEVGVTPLQMVNAYSVVANGGYLMEPHVIKNIINQKGIIEWSAEPVVVRKILSSETINRLKKILALVVESGTGTRGKVNGYRVCAKTGTAQQIDEKTRQYSDEKYLASFCGFLPESNPRICIMVCLDSPKGSYWGGVIAAPIFSRIGSRVMAYLNVPPDDNRNPADKNIEQYAHIKKVN